MAKPDMILYRPCPEPKLEGKALEGDGGFEGEITGYASIWAVVDSQGDIVRRGAFAKTIKERVAAGKVALMVIHYCHGGDVKECIGQVVEAKEDDIGLWFRAKVYATSDAQATRTKVMASPHLYGSSIGYSVIANSAVVANGKKRNSLDELMLWEITVTLKPANDKTVVSAKTEESIIEKMQAELVCLRDKVEQLATKPNSTAAAPAAGSTPAPAAKTAAVHSRARAFDRWLEINQLESELTEVESGRHQGNSRQDEDPRGRDRQGGG